MKRLAALVALMLLLPTAAAAEELSWLGARLSNGPGQPWIWKLDSRQDPPAGLSLAQVETSFQTAFQRWDEVSCSFLSFGFDGRDPAAGARQPDGKNVMGVFVSSRAADEEIYDLALGGGMAIAVALPLYYGGTIYECDVAFNSADYHWSADGNPLRFDLPTVALHESGHCLGLGHWSKDLSSVMNPFLQPGELRHGLATHDLDNLCQLYPQVGAVGSPCPAGSCASGLTCLGSGPTAFCTQGCDPEAVGGCPVGFSCLRSALVPGSSGSCAFGGGASTRIGAPCATGDDCGGAGDAVCLLDPLNGWWEGGYCSAECGPARACPASSSCHALGANPERCYKSCRPGSGDCRFGYACEPMGEGKGRCLPACRSDAHCPGALCDLCSGLCVHPGKPGAQVGDSCLLDEDCPAGGQCRQEIAGGSCTLSCESHCTGCPQGSVCLPFEQTGERLCFKSCAGPADCPSPLGCWQQAEGGGCLPACVQETDCPVGQSCLSGSCLRPTGPDAGCALCDGRDGGLPPVSRPDASEDGAQLPPQGCGCSAGGLSPALLALAPLVFGRRRRERIAPGG